MIQPLAGIPVSGKCDNTGAATIAINGPVEFWSAVYLAVEVSAGTPSWTVRGDAAAGLPLIFGSGTQAMLGPFLLPPRKVITLVLTGAAANAQVDGQVLGWVATTPQELPKQLPSMSTVNITGGNVTAVISGTPAVTISGTPTVQFAAGQQVNIGTVSGTINIQGVTGGINVGTNAPMVSIDSKFTISAQTAHTNLVLPTGANAVLVMATTRNTSGIQVVGHQSSWNMPVSGPYTGSGTHSIYIAPITVADTSVDITYSVSAGSVTYQAFALIGPEATNILNRIQANLYATDTPLAAVASALAVTRQGVGTGPAPWEAPTAWARVRITSNTTTNMVAANGSMHIYVFGWYLGMDGATNGVLAHLQDGTPRPFGALTGNGAAVSFASITGYHNGLDLGSGSKIDLLTDSVPGGGGVEAIVSYTQALAL